MVRVDSRLTKKIWLGGPPLKNGEGWVWLAELGLEGNLPDKTTVQDGAPAIDFANGLRLLRLSDETHDVTFKKLAESIADDPAGPIIIGGEDNPVRLEHRLKQHTSMLFTAAVAPDHHEGLRNRIYFGLDETKVREKQPLVGSDAIGERDRGNEIHPAYSKWGSRLSLSNHAQTTIVEPAEPWPVQRDWVADRRVGGKKVDLEVATLPIFRLVAGRIETEITRPGSTGRQDPEEGPNAPVHRLNINFDTGKVLENIRFREVAGDVFPCAFAPGGIEFKGRIRNPFPDPEDQNGAESKLELEFRLCHVQDLKAGWVLELIGGKANDLLILRRGLEQKFNAINDKEGTPLRLAYNGSDEVPKLSWPLTVNENRSLTFREDNYRLSPSVLQVSLVTDVVGRAQESAVAWLTDAISEQVSPDVLVFRSGVRKISERFVRVRWTKKADEGWQTTKVSLQSKNAADPVPVIIETGGLEERLTALYRTSKAMREEDTTAPYAFLPVDRGFLQVPLPMGKQTEEYRTTGNEPIQKRDAFTGNIGVYYPRPPGQEDPAPRKQLPRRYAGLDAAESVEIRSETKTELVNGIEQKTEVITLTAWGGTGQMHGFLWAVESSPTPEEVIPTVETGPLATQSIPILFDLDNKREARRCAHWLEPQNGSESWSLTLKSLGGVEQAGDGRKVWTWLSHAVLPAVSGMPITRTAPSVSTPSVTRGLIPQEVNSTENGSLIKLHGSLKHMTLPAIESEQRRIEASGPAVVPTLPDIEFEPVSGKHGPEGFGKMRLSFSLPVLDEYFASVSLPKKGPVDQQSSVDQGILQSEPYPTALYPGDLKDVWKRLSVSRSLTETQSQYATKNLDFGSGTDLDVGSGSTINGALDYPDQRSEMGGLVEPYTWPVAIKPYERYDINGTLVPFGRYSLRDQVNGKAIYFENVSALAGLGGGAKGPSYFEIVENNKLLLKGDEEPESNAVRVTGYAAASMDDEIDGRPATRDSRGFSQSARDDREFGGRLTVRPFSMPDRTPDLNMVNRLVTLSSMETWATLQGFNGDLERQLKFWVRELPMKLSSSTYQFDYKDGTAEENLAPGADALDAETVPFSLYEWRCFLGGNKGRFDIPFGPITFKPLRLLTLKLAQQDDEVEILGSIELTVTGRDHDSVYFPGEDPYATGNLAVLKICKNSSVSLRRFWRTTDKQEGGAERTKLSEDKNRGSVDKTFKFLVPAYVLSSHSGLPDLSHGSGGPDQTLRLEVGLKPDSTDVETVRLTADLFGQPVIQTLKLSGTGDSGQTQLFSWEKKGQVTTGSAVIFDGLYLELNTKTGLARLGYNATLNVKASFKTLEQDQQQDATSLTVAQFSSQAVIRNEIGDGEWPMAGHWLGIALHSLDWKVDHRTGAISIAANQKVPQASVIAGLGSEDLDVTLSVTATTAPIVHSQGADSHGGLGIGGRLTDEVVEIPVHGGLLSGSAVKHPTGVRVARQSYFISKDPSNQNLYLSLALADKRSGIHWPVGGLSAPKVVNNHVAYALGPTDEVLGHKVTVRLNEHKLPLVLLRGLAGRPVFYQSWRVVARADHEFGGEDKKIRWSSLDYLTISTRSVETNSAKRELDKSVDRKDWTNAPAPLYFRANYRNYDWTVFRHPGTVRKVFGLSGFQDPYLLQDLTKPDPIAADGDQDILVFGTSTVLTPTKAHPTDSARLLILPYVISPTGALPAPYDKIQEVEEEHHWSVSKADASADRDLSVGSFNPRPLGHCSGPEAELLRQIRDVNKPTASGENVPAIPVDQSIFEPRDPDVQFEFQNTPIFLRSLIALKAQWEYWKTSAVPEKGHAFPFIITRSEKESGSSVSELAIISQTAEAPSASSSLEHRTVAIAFMGKDFVETVMPQTASPYLIVSDSASRRMIMDSVSAHLSEPQAILVAKKESDSSGQAAFYSAPQEIEIPRSVDDVVLSQIKSLRDKADTVYPSAHLGWPLDICNSKLSPGGAPQDKEKVPIFQTRVGPDEPYQSEAAGFSGRTAQLAILPWAKPASDTAPIYLWSSTKTPFVRPEESFFVAPPSNHIGGARSRARVPLGGGVGAKENKGIPIVPPLVERSRIGQRPGILNAAFDGLLVSDQREFDVEERSSGRTGKPGSFLTLAARQHRIPRSVALPRDYSLDVMRRTYVSLADGWKDPEKSSWNLDPFLWLSGTSVALRLRDTDNSEETRLLIRVKDADSLTLTETWSGKIAVHVEIQKARLTSDGNQGDPGQGSTDVSEQDVTKVLAGVGLLRGIGEGHETDLAVALSIGEAKFFFEVVTVTISAGRATLIFDRVADLGDAVQAISAAAGDTRASINFYLAPPDAGTSAPNSFDHLPLRKPSELDQGIVAGPPRNFDMPLLLAPADRPTLPVQMSSVIFADPSYDRILASRANTGKKRLNKQPWIVAVDRQEYDPQAHLYFAVGIIDEDTLSFVAEDDSTPKPLLRFSIQRADAPAGSPPQDVLLADARNADVPDEYKKQQKAWYGIDLAKSYAVRLTDFRTVAVEDNKIDYEATLPITLYPGDKVLVTAEFLDRNDEYKDQGLEVRSTVVAEPVIAPPPSVYSFVRTDTGANSRADVPLYATGPMPQLIEFPALADDLAKGFVRRRALYFWRYSEITLNEKDVQATLVKVDRSGGGQLPSVKSDLKVRA